MFKAVERPVKKVAERAKAWGRRNSLWLLHLGIMCCAIEMMQAGFAFHDFERLGVLARATPRQVDVMLLNGPINRKMAERIRRLLMQTPGPRYVIIMGECPIKGGPWWESDYVLKGFWEIYDSLPEEIRKQIKIVSIAGCPPRPEAIIRAILKMEEKIEGVELDKVPLTKYKEPKEKRSVNPIRKYIREG